VSCGKRATKASYFMANPKRVRALLEMSDEDLAGAKLLLGSVTRLARYHVQRGAEKAVKALLEYRGFEPGPGAPVRNFVRDVSSGRSMACAHICTPPAVSGGHFAPLSHR
jgi:hypothetical protein